MESDGDVVQIVRCVLRNVMSGGWREVDRSWIAIEEGESALWKKGEDGTSDGL